MGGMHSVVRGSDSVVRWRAVLQDGRGSVVRFLHQLFATQYDQTNVDM